MMPSRTSLTDAAVIASANSIVWTLQDISAVMAILVSAVSCVWIGVQTIRFCQRWWREERAIHARGELECRLRRQLGACPVKAPPTTAPGDLT